MSTTTQAPIPETIENDNETKNETATEQLPEVLTGRRPADC